MNHDVLRQAGLKYLIPSNHLLLVLLKDLQQPRVEVSLQRVIVFDPLLLHVSLNRGIAVPLLAFVLIAADVQVVVREERSHFTEKRFQEFVDFFARRIERGLENSRAALNRVWTRCAAELRMTH